MGKSFTMSKLDAIAKEFGLSGNIFAFTEEADIARDKMIKDSMRFHRGPQGQYDSSLGYRITNSESYNNVKEIIQGMNQANFNPSDIHPETRKISSSPKTIVSQVNNKTDASIIKEQPKEVATNTIESNADVSEKVAQQIEDTVPNNSVQQTATPNSSPNTSPNNPVQEEINDKSSLWNDFKRRSLTRKQIADFKQSGGQNTFTEEMNKSLQSGDRATKYMSKRLASQFSSDVSKLENLYSNASLNPEQAKELNSIYSRYNNAQDLAGMKNYIVNQAKQGPEVMDYVMGYKVPQTALGFAIAGGVISSMWNNGGQKSNAELYSNPF